MASKRGMTMRAEQADARIDAAVEQIAVLGDVDVQPRPSYRRDPIRQTTERLERIASILEQAVAVMTDIAAQRDQVTSELETARGDGGDEPEPNGGNISDLQLDRDAFMALKFADLKSLAVGAGAEGVEPMRSRAEVVDAMEAQLASLSFESAPVEIVEGVVRPAGADSGAEN